MKYLRLFTWVQCIWITVAVYYCYLYALDSQNSLSVMKSCGRLTTVSSIPTTLQIVDDVRDSAILSGNTVIVVLVLTCNRTKSVQKCLDKLLKYRTSPHYFPIVVSHSCSHEPTSIVLNGYGSRVTLIQHQINIQLRYADIYFQKYYYIARHYHWALNQMFFNFNFQAAIVLEDDIEVASDFFEYFSATLPILRGDPSLWCVSAWNDNGKASLVDDNQPEQLYRTDFFPGLAWMLTRETWIELEPKWPSAFWDDWMRFPEQRQNRACIRPELPRARIFDKEDKNKRSFYNKHLKFMKLSEKFINFTNKNLNYLLKDNYDMEFVRRAYDSPELTYLKLIKCPISNPGRVRYVTKRGFMQRAGALGLMKDFRSGVPRTAYRGIVTFMYKGQRLYLTPYNWTSYNTS